MSCQAFDLHDHITPSSLSSVIAMVPLLNAVASVLPPCFIFFWSTIVYNPLARVTWNAANGWSFVEGGLDFAAVSHQI